MKCWRAVVAVLLGTAAAALPAFCAAQTPAADQDYVPVFRPLKHGQAPGMHVQLLSQDNGQRTYAVIFSTGDEVLAGLTEFAEKEHLGASRITGIGALEGATLGWFDVDKKLYRPIRVHDQVEVTSMVGDIASMNGKPIVHVHLTVAHQDGHLTGGHLIEAHVRPTLEVLVTEYPHVMQKGMDPNSGLSVIQPELGK